jgi:hypothetical protein
LPASTFLIDCDHKFRFLRDTPLPPEFLPPKKNSTLIQARHREGQGQGRMRNRLIAIKSAKVPSSASVLIKLVRVFFFSRFFCFSLAI